MAASHTRSLLLAMVFMAVAVNAKKGLAVQEIIAPSGSTLVSITCFLDPGDRSVLGFTTTNADGTTDDECLAGLPANAVAQDLTFQEPVRRVIITSWQNKSAALPERLGRLTFVSKGKKQSCGLRRPKTQRHGVVVRRGVVKAPQKNMTLSALAVDTCGPPRGFTVYWSPTNCGGGTKGKGKGWRQLQLASCAGERLKALLSKEMFETMFPLRNLAPCSNALNVEAGKAAPYRNCYTRFCPANTVWRDWIYNGGAWIPVSAPYGPTYPANQYEWETLVEAARSFPTFLDSPDESVRKRELAAFLAQISHETTGIGYPATTIPGYEAQVTDGLGGLCHREEGPGGDCSIDGACASFPPPPGYVGGCCPPGTDEYPRRSMSAYCDTTSPVECAPGAKYYGRGAKQLSYQYNYKSFGEGKPSPGLARTMATFVFVSISSPPHPYPLPLLPRQPVVCPSCSKIRASSWRTVSCR